MTLRRTAFDALLDVVDAGGRVYIDRASHEPSLCRVSITFRDRHSVDAFSTECLHVGLFDALMVERVDRMLHPERPTLSDAAAEVLEAFGNDDDSALVDAVDKLRETLNR